jgi:hypothetical protein
MVFGVSQLSPAESAQHFSRLDGVRQRKRRRV